MSRLLGYEELARHFKLLKSKDKLIAQDELWEKVCAQLEGFEFERSVI